MVEITAGTAVEETVEEAVAIEGASPANRVYREARTPPDVA